MIVSEIMNNLVSIFEEQLNPLLEAEGLDPIKKFSREVPNPKDDSNLPSLGVYYSIEPFIRNDEKASVEPIVDILLPYSSGNKVDLYAEVLYTFLVEELTDVDVKEFGLTSTIRDGANAENRIASLVSIVYKTLVDEEI